MGWTTEGLWFQFLADAKYSSIQTVRAGSMTQTAAYWLITDIYFLEDSADGA